MQTIVVAREIIYSNFCVSRVRGGVILMKLGKLIELWRGNKLKQRGGGITARRELTENDWECKPPGVNKYTGRQTLKKMKWASWTTKITSENFRETSCSRFLSFLRCSLRLSRSLLWDDSYSLLTIDDDQWVFTHLKIITTFFSILQHCITFTALFVLGVGWGWIGTQLVHSNAREKPTHPLTSSAREETRSVCCCVVQFCRCINQFLIQQGGKMAAKINYRLGVQARPK